MDFCLHGCCLKKTALNLIGMRGDTFISLSPILDQILSADFLSKLSKLFEGEHWRQLLPPKSLECFDKKSADKIWSKNDKEIKVSPLMPIRVKTFCGIRYCVKYSVIYF